MPPSASGVRGREMRQGQGDETAPRRGSSSSAADRAGQLVLVAMRMGRELSGLLVQVRKDRFMRINLLNSQLLALAFSLNEFTGNSPWVGTPHPGATDIEIANTYLKNAYQKSLGKHK